MYSVNIYSIVDCLVVQLQNFEAVSEYAVYVELDPVELQPHITQSLVHVAPFWLHRVALNSESVSSFEVTYTRWPNTCDISLLCRSEYILPYIYILKLHYYFMLLYYFMHYAETRPVEKAEPLKILSSEMDPAEIRLIL